MESTNREVIRVEIDVMMDDELVMSYSQTDGWPQEDVPTPERIKHAGKAVYKLFRENF
jgi:hypothetical protein